MGLHIGFSSCRNDTPQTKAVYVEVPAKQPMPNPNKYRWSIQAQQTFANKWTVVVILYHDCVNYEGRKVLVYDDYAKFNQLKLGGALDPHFDDKTYSPIARFEPTARGIELAVSFARSQR